MQIVNFHLHSEFSFLTSLLRIEKTAIFLKENGFSGFALTDTLSTYGFEQLKYVCKKYSLKAAFGLQIFVNGIVGRSKFPIIIIALNKEGIKNLFFINSIANKRFCQKGSFSIPFDILQKNNKGLAVLLGDELLTEDDERVKKTIEAYQTIFGENFYIEVNYTGEQKISILRKVVSVVEEKKLNGIATCEARYERLDKHFFEQLCMLNEKMKGKGSYLKSNYDFSLKSMDEMIHYFKNHSDYLMNSEKLLEKIEPVKERKEFYLPPFSNSLKKLRSLCEARIREGNFNAVYRERLSKEVSEIESYNLGNFFLLARDIARFLKIKRISSYYEGKNLSYSLVAYLLKISPLNPVFLKLPFDFFIDSIENRTISLRWKVCWKKKKKIFPFLSNKYGREKVIFLARMEKLNRRLALRYFHKKESPENQDLKAFLSLIERIPFKADLNADAFSFFPENISSITSIEYSRKNLPFAQMTQRDAEAKLLPPIILSSNREISILEEIKKVLRVSEIPLEDSETFKTIADGNTTGISSLEHYGIRNFLQRVKVDNFALLIDVLSVYRESAFSGGLTVEYLKRRSNHLYYGKVSPKAHETHPVTWDTYGLILYEEQIYSIMQDMANLDKKISFQLLKAMKKKDSVKIVKFKPLFIEGCIKRGADEYLAQRLFSILVETAPHTIDKIDVSEKALLSYELAYLKTHYALNFYVTVLNNHIDSREHLNTILLDIKFQEDLLEILPVDINMSKTLFSIEGKDKIRAGLICVKGLNMKNSSLIVAERNLHGPYKDLIQFLYRMSGNSLHEKTVECLIKAGAFSSDYFRKTLLLKKLPLMIKAISKIKNEKEQGLFNKEEEINLLKQEDGGATPPIESRTWEHEATGLYLTSHPLSCLIEKLKSFTVNSVKEINALEYGTFIVHLFQLKKFMTRNGIRMASGRITDLSGIADIAFIPEVYKKYESILKNHTAYLVKGKIRNKRLFADQIFLL